MKLGTQITLYLYISQVFLLSPAYSMSNHHFYVRICTHSQNLSGIKQHMSHCQDSRQTRLQIHHRDPGAYAGAKAPAT
jgi:hypothetical protein